MKQIKIPTMCENCYISSKIKILPCDNAEFYYDFQINILRELLNIGKIKQVQYELCIKELYNKKYGL